MGSRFNVDWVSTRKYSKSYLQAAKYITLPASILNAMFGEKLFQESTRLYKM